MPLPILPPNVDFKKEYKFFWYIQYPILKSTNLFKASGTAGTDAEAEKLNASFTKLFNTTASTYISQLASEVQPPEDELELEMVDIGNVQYPSPLKIKRNDIKVTYLEDTINSVYNFHRYWNDLARSGNSLYFNPLKSLCCEAYYITFENSITSAEYQSLLKLMESENSISALLSYVDVFVKPTSIVKYPLIFPTIISRSTANKQGTGLGTVTINYTRVPKLKKTSPYREYTISSK